MNCVYQRVQRLALDPLEQLRREIELDPIEQPDEPEVRAPRSREEIAIFELVWGEDTSTAEEEG
jgi:hypothetical protein